MCLLFSLMIMLILAVGSCKEYIEVETIEGGNASLPFTTVGLMIFREIDCEKRTMITKIGRYCGLDENCTTNLSTPFSIESGNLIVRNVTSNRCFSAELMIQGTRNIKTFYNVTINKLLNSTISTETPTTTFTTETDDYTSTDSYNNIAFSVPRDVVVVVFVFVVVVVAAAAVVVVILVTIVLLAAEYKEVCESKRCCSMMLAKVSHEETLMEKLESANSLLTTVNETQL